MTSRESTNESCWYWKWICDSFEIESRFYLYHKISPVLPQCSDLSVNIMLGVFKRMKKNALWYVLGGFYTSKKSKLFYTVWIWSKKIRFNNKHIFSSNSSTRKVYTLSFHPPQTFFPRKDKTRQISTTERTKGLPNYPSIWVKMLQFKVICSVSISQAHLQ